MDQTTLVAPVLEQTTEYRTAQVDHQVALRQAGEDPVLKAQAEQAWAEKRLELTQQHGEKVAAMTARQTAQDRIKAAMPDVPEHIYATVGTPEEMEAVAKAFHDALEAAKTQTTQAGAAAAAAGASTAGISNAAMGQPPTGLETPPAGGMNPVEARLREIAPKIQMGRATPAEVIEFQNTIINGIIQPAMVNAKNAARRTA